jgi:hypothetical protein
MTRTLKHVLLDEIKASLEVCQPLGSLKPHVTYNATADVRIEGDEIKLTWFEGGEDIQNEHKATIRVTLDE